MFKIGQNLQSQIMLFIAKAQANIIQIQNLNLSKLTAQFMRGVMLNLI